MTQTQSALDYPAAARSIALNLEQFCDESLPYPEMIADAARKASAHIAQLTADAARYRDQLKHACDLAMMAGAKICLPVSEKDIEFAKSCLEPLYQVALQLHKEDRAASPGER